VAAFAIIVSSLAPFLGGDTQGRRALHFQIVVYHIPTSKVDFAAVIVVRCGTIVPGKILDRYASGDKRLGTPGASNSSQTTKSAACCAAADARPAERAPRKKMAPKIEAIA